MIGVMNTPSESPEVEAFVAAARAALPGEDLSRFKIRNFGPMGNVLVPLIASGEKTGTFALAEDFAADPASAPATDDLYVVLDVAGHPALLYRILEAYTLPFGDIAHEHVQVEGKQARTVEAWRAIHWPYWGATLRARGRDVSMQTPVIFQRFRVLYPAQP